MPRINIHVMEHRKSGLFAAVSDDLAGFIVHGHTEEELVNKLAPAFEAFMEAIGTPVRDVRVEQSSPEGFWPPAYVARGELQKAAWVCSVDDYWPRIKRIPLIIERETGDKEAFLCRTLEGEPVRVTKPEVLGTDEKRAAAVEQYEAFFRKLPN